MSAGNVKQHFTTIFFRAKMLLQIPARVFPIARDAPREQRGNFDPWPRGTSAPARQRHIFWCSRFRENKALTRVYWQGTRDDRGHKSAGQERHLNRVQIVE
jgi:hypothetical protein